MHTDYVLYWVLIEYTLEILYICMLLWIIVPILHYNIYIIAILYHDSKFFYLEKLDSAIFSWVKVLSCPVMEPMASFHHIDKLFVHWILLWPVEFL